MEKTTQPNYDKVAKLLADFGKQMGKKQNISRVTLDGKIDFKKFDEFPLVKNLIAELKKMKVTGKWLCAKGFIPAMLVLGALLAKKK